MCTNKSENGDSNTFISLITLPGTEQCVLNLWYTIQLRLLKHLRGGQRFRKTDPHHCYPRPLSKFLRSC